MDRVANWLCRLKWPRADGCTHTGPDARPPASHHAHAPVGDCFPAQAVEEVLAAQQDVIDRIRIGFGMGRAEFEQQPYAAVRRYARLVHLLPATRDRHFNAPSGLLRMGLEVALFALQGTDGHIFCGRATISVRRQLEPRWRHATFLAGLCHGIDRAVWQLTAADEQGSAWQPAVLPLADWLLQRGAMRYVVTWCPTASGPACPGMLALAHVIAPDVLRDLATDNTSIVPQLLVSLADTRQRDERNVLDALVRRAHALVIARASPSGAGENAVGHAASDEADRLPMPATCALNGDGDRAATEPAPVQLVLPIDAAPDMPPPACALPSGEASADSSALAPAPVESQPLPSGPRVQIEAPLRLHAAVRHALIAIVDTLNPGAAEPACQPTPSGLFIPLAAFACRGVDVALALRALAEADMLARPGALDVSTLMPARAGDPELGLLLACRFVAGLPGGEQAAMCGGEDGHAVAPL